MDDKVRKMENGDYTIRNGNYVGWTGEPHESWNVLANQLRPDEVLAVLCAAQATPQPHGDGKRALDVCLLDADFAISTNCGRQLTFDECAKMGPLSRGQQLACDVLLEAKRLAVKHQVSYVGILRLLFCVRSHGQQNMPHDSYARLCSGSLKSY